MRKVNMLSAKEVKKAKPLEKPCKRMDDEACTMKRPAGLGSLLLLIVQGRRCRPVFFMKCLGTRWGGGGKSLFCRSGGDGLAPDRDSMWLSSADATCGGER